MALAIWKWRHCIGNVLRRDPFRFPPVFRRPVPAFQAEWAFTLLGVDAVFLAAFRRLIAGRAELARARILAGIDGFVFVLMACNHEFKEANNKGEG